MTIDARKASKELLEPASGVPSILKLEKEPADVIKRKKPEIGKFDASTQDLKARLSAFIPDLKAANDALPSDTSPVNIEHLDDEEKYIEMDLGLGVLEEKHDQDAISEEDGHVMDKLMKRNKGTPAAIVVVDDEASILPDKAEKSREPKAKRRRKSKKD